MNNKISINTDTEFMKDLEKLINKHCIENKSDTPDFILAKYLTQCLNSFNYITKERDLWHGFESHFHDQTIELTSDK